MIRMCLLACLLVKMKFWKRLVVDYLSVMTDDYSSTTTSVQKNFLLLLEIFDDIISLWIKINSRDS